MYKRFKLYEARINLSHMSTSEAIAMSIRKAMC